MEQNINASPASQPKQPPTEEEKKELLHRVNAEKEERYRIAIEVTGIGTWDLDLLTNTVYWDDLCKELYGFHKDDIVPYEMVLNGMHPDDASKVDEAVKAALNPAVRAPYDMIFRTIGVDDHKLRWLHCKGIAKFNEEGQPVRFTGTAQDITKQREQQQWLATSEARYRDLIENSSIGKVVFRGRDMVVDLINDAMLGIWGKDRNVIGKRLCEAMPELEGQPFLSQLQMVFDTGMPFSLDEGLAYISKNGEEPSPYWFQYSYRALYNGEGKIYGIINTASDITSVVETKQRIKEANEELKFILDAARLGTWKLDIDTNTIFFDERAKELFGYPLSKSITLHEAVNAVYEEDRDLFSRAIANACRREVSDGNLDVEQRTREGNRWLRMKGKASFDEKGNPTQLAGVFIDITPQKELLTVKDDFIKMASHELKTPISSAIAYAQLLEMELAKNGDEKIVFMAKKLRAQVAMLNSLVGDLLDVSKMKGNRLNYEEINFDFDELANAAIEEVQVITSTHHIEKRLHTSCTVYGDKDRIRQVIINLITNAIKYSPNAKRIIVSTTLKEDEIRMCVEDFGIGIPKEKQERVFEQFYRVGKDQRVFPGLGLGLYISSQIIQNTEGRIWIEASEEGRGSTFCFALPCDYRTSNTKYE